MERTVPASLSTMMSLPSCARYPSGGTPPIHILLLRGGDLVANALADDLALELREGQQNVERQAPHRGRRVELLRHRNKGRVLGVEDLDNLGKIGERAGQPVDLVDGNGVEPPRLHIS